MDDRVGMLWNTTMLTASIEIVGSRVLKCDAIIDTGFSGGLLLPKALARQAGARLLKADRLPRMADGRELAGQKTVLLVRVPDAGVEAETFVFCPDEGDDVLLGAFYLAAVDAKVTIGTKTYRFPRRRKANPGPDMPDVGEWIIPRRPVTKWW